MLRYSPIFVAVLLIDENQFDAANYSVGERVLATWDEAQASLLNRSSVTVPSPEKAA